MFRTDTAYLQAPGNKEGQSSGRALDCPSRISSLLGALAGTTSKPGFSQSYFDGFCGLGFPLPPFFLPPHPILSAPLRFKGRIHKTSKKSSKNTD